MKKIYIAGPYRGKNGWEVERNVQAAEKVTMLLAENGYIPICPHTMYRNFDRTISAEFWIKATMEIMELCDGIFVLSNWKESEGTCGEIKRAKELNIPILFEKKEDQELFEKENDKEN